MTNSEKKRLSVSQKMAVTAGALTALAPAAAEADIVYIDDNPISASAFDGQGFSINWDVDGVGGAEFQMWARTSSFFTGQFFSSNSFFYSQVRYGILNFASQGYFGTALNGQGLVGDGANGANALNAGEVIGPTLNNYQWGSTNALYRNAARFDEFGYYNQSMSTFSGGTNIGVSFLNFELGTNLLGFRFDQNGDLHYGWAELEFTGGAGITINRWAYESDANTAIRAGAIPEPNSLALLGIGAAGVLTMRRRRKEESEQE